MFEPVSMPILLNMRHRNQVGHIKVSHWTLFSLCMHNKAHVQWNSFNVLAKNNSFIHKALSRVILRVGQSTVTSNHWSQLCGCGRVRAVFSTIQLRSWLRSLWFSDLKSCISAIVLAYCCLNSENWLAISTCWICSKPRNIKQTQNGWWLHLELANNFSMHVTQVWMHLHEPCQPPHSCLFRIAHRVAQVFHAILKCCANEFGLKVCCTQGPLTADVVCIT